VTGSVATFYSYKGGVGRSSLLANAAVVLGRWGYRVLCIDWDLDAPGLAFYFRPYIPEVDRGLLDLVEALARDGGIDAGEFVMHADVPDLSGSVDFLPAGSEDDDYVRRVQKLDWDTLYDEHNFGRRLERVRAQWVEKYDVVLIDSRTGITDIGGICTGQLPDTIVEVFTANGGSSLCSWPGAKRRVAAFRACCPVCSTSSFPRRRRRRSGRRLRPSIRRCGRE
jgi:MinD-like ATPase involved in chromosome partitioning or flagellar assembly